MKILLNTLYVTTPDAYLSKDGANVVISVKNEEIFRIPILNIESIITFGYQGASPGIMKLCAENGVALSFFTPNGRFVSRIQGPVSGNVLLRKRQYELMNDQKFSFDLVKTMIEGKIYNSRSCLRRFVRDYPNHERSPLVEKATDRLKQIYRNLRGDSIDVLRGYEGEAAEVYFKAFPNLILNDNPIFSFIHRNRRPPTDVVNTMLSFGYSLLANDCTAALEGVGLDPAAGYLHTLRPGRNSLALDIMEEMRAYIVDRLVISMINNRQMDSSDFKRESYNDMGQEVPVLFTEKGLKKFLAAWQNKKKTEITHPYLNEKIKVGLLPHVQARLLAGYIRGDIDGYPVFFIK